MRLRLRRRALRRPATFEPLETRCVLSSLSWEVGPVRPLPTEESVQTALESTGRFGDGVQLDKVRSLYGLTGQGQTVAVIDTGIAYDQRALGGGFGPEARVVGGWDVAEQDSDPYDDAPAGFHGTHVAGILAAADDRRPGVAPGVDLVALRVFDDLGNGKLEWVEQALRWIARNRNAFRYPITTVNLSLGTNYNGDRPPDYAILEDELKTLWESGVLVVAAAGNSFAQYGRPGVSYPAASPYVLPVASLDADGRLSRFSQRSTRTLAAPGENIVSTVPDHLLSRDRVDDDWAAASGTSMASPIVAGAAALVREAMSVYQTTLPSPQSILSVLRNSASSVYDPLTSRSYATLDLPAALASLVPEDDYADTTADASSIGIVDNVATIQGLAETTQDRDVVRFQVSAPGWLSVNVDGVGGAPFDASVVGAERILQDTQWVYAVVPGRDYYLEVAPTERIGRYQAQLELEPSAAMDLGTIEQTTVRLGSGTETRATFTASQDGWLTLRTSTESPNWRLVRQDGSSVEPVRDYRFGGWRIDVRVTTGERMFVEHLSGDPVSIDLVNRVELRRGVLTVTGGLTEMTVIALGTRIHVNLGGVRYAWRADQIRSIGFLGDGADRLRIYGSRQSETARWQNETLQWKSLGTSLQATGLGWVDLVGGGGDDDVLRIQGSEGKDTFVVTPDSVRLESSRRALQGRGFDRAYLDGGAGRDEARLIGSPDNDTLLSYADAVRFFGPGFHVRLQGIESLDVAGGGGKDDVARFYGSSLAEQWLGGPGGGQWSAGSQRRRVRDFDRLYVYGLDAWNDQVTLQGGVADSRFRVRRDQLEQRSDRFYQRIEGWKSARLIGADEVWDEVWIDPLRDSSAEESEGESPWWADRGLRLDAIDQVFGDWPGVASSYG